MADTEAAVRAQWESALGPDARPDQSFLAQGGDSLAAVVFTLRLLDSTGVELEFNDVLEAPDLVTVIATARRQR